MSYVELHAKSNFSFLEGASHPEELVERAAELGYPAMAVTDQNSLAGIVRAHSAAKESGCRLIVGAEITPEDAWPVVLWVTNRTAYGQLCRLITRGRRRAEKGDCRISMADIAELHEGLLAGIVPQGSSARRLDEYRQIFGKRCYLLAELHRGPDDRRRLARWVALSRQMDVPLVAAGDVYYHVPQRRPLQDVLTAIRLGTTVSEAAKHLFANARRHLQSPEVMVRLFADAPGALHRTLEIAEQCAFSLDELRYEYPEELAPTGQTPAAYLARLTWAGARWRYPQGVPEKVQRLLEHELRLIEELHYEAYFLTVWDLVRFARRRGILCQGRGSAANSAVCYCLGITAVDPDRVDLLFERFISRERNEAPDIDVDFEHQRREEVLQYLYQKYGRERAGLTAEVVCYRPRSAVRDVGKALGLSLDRVDALAKSVEKFRHESELDQRCREVGLDPDSRLGRQLTSLVDQLVGFPRHLSQHTGGMVITRGALCELVPIENAAMPDRTVIQWNKDDLDELGILKVDCLALGMLSAIRRCFALVRRYHGRKLALATVPPDDRDVYRMISRADTMGVFQIESRAQMSMLPRLRPKCFYDLVIEVAIVRPGPIQGNMVHPYLRRRNGEEPAHYPTEAIRGVLEKTLGVSLFQEQAMRLAVVAAGFTPGEADQLRRAMGAWRKPGLIDRFRRKLIAGMKTSGLTPEYAAAVFQQIRGFGEYGFPESHAASFALLVYVSAWLKYHYPAAFTAALINSQPMGFYAPAQLVRNARDHGVEVRPVDVNRSDWECTLEPVDAGEPSSTKPAPTAGFFVDTDSIDACITNERRTTSGSPVFRTLRSGAPIIDNAGINSSDAKEFALRLGFCTIHGMLQQHAERIESVRNKRPFSSINQFARRTGFSRAVLKRLAEANAFGSMEIDRREALWRTLAQDQKPLPLLEALEETDGPPSTLPAMSEAQQVLADYRAVGMSLTKHPLCFLRAGLQRDGAVEARRLTTIRNGSYVRVAGIVLVRQRPSTAKGITFVTLEDETGTANLIVRPDVWQRFRKAARGAAIMLAAGRLQRCGAVIHVVVAKLENLSPRLAALGSRSRDFC